MCAVIMVREFAVLCFKHGPTLHGGNLCKWIQVVNCCCVDWKYEFLVEVVMHRTC